MPELNLTHARLIHLVKTSQNVKKIVCKYLVK